MSLKRDLRPAVQFSNPVMEAHTRIILTWRAADRVELLHALCCSLMGSVNEPELRATEERIRPLLDQFTAGHNYLDALGVMLQLSALLQERARGER